MAGVNGSALVTEKPNESKTQTAFDWCSCVQAFSGKYLGRLADWRGLSGALYGPSVQGTTL
jgi:hypothetical protein